MRIIHTQLASHISETPWCVSPLIDAQSGQAYHRRAARMDLWMASLTSGSLALIGINPALEHQPACEAASLLQTQMPCRATAKG